MIRLVFLGAIGFDLPGKVLLFPVFLLEALRDHCFAVASPQVWSGKSAMEIRITP